LCPTGPRPAREESKKTAAAWVKFSFEGLDFFLLNLRFKLGLPFVGSCFKDMKKTSSTARRSAPVRTAEAFFMSLKQEPTKGRSPVQLKTRFRRKKSNPPKEISGVFPEQRI